MDYELGFDSLDFDDEPDVSELEGFVESSFVEELPVLDEPPFA